MSVLFKVYCLKNWAKLSKQPKKLSEHMLSPSKFWWNGQCKFLTFEEQIRLFGSTQIHRAQCINGHRWNGLGLKSENFAGETTVKEYLMGQNEDVSLDYIFGREPNIDHEIGNAPIVVD